MNEVASVGIYLYICCSYRKIYNTSSNSTLPKSISVFPPQTLALPNFGGKKIVIAANPFSMFANLIQNEDGTFYALGGIDIDICDLLAEKLNFT